MTDKPLKDRVVVITGAAGSLGRAYSTLFAELGAKLLLNDLNTSLTGKISGSPSNPQLESLVKEINSKYPNHAVGNTNDVVKQGEAIIQAAISSFGRIDVLINNAGFLHDVSFKNMTQQQFDEIIAVHLTSVFTLCKAAWPHFVNQKYGRIINTSSIAGIHGNFGQANYSAAKSGLLGFTKSLAIEGAKYGISSNVIAPIARSRMSESAFPEDLLKELDPQFVAPVVAYLASDRCKDSGAVIESAAGWIGKTKIYTTNGAVIPSSGDGKPPTFTNVERVWSSVDDDGADDTSSAPSSRKGFYPTSGKDTIAHILSRKHQQASQPLSTHQPPTVQSEPPSVSPSSTPPIPTPLIPGNQTTPSEDGFECDRIVRILSTLIDDEVVGSAQVVLGFEITKKGKESRKFTIDLKNNRGGVIQHEHKSLKGGKVDATLIMSDDLFVKIVRKEAEAQHAYLSSKLKIRGNLSSALKFESVLKSFEHRMPAKL